MFDGFLLFRIILNKAKCCKIDLFICIFVYNQLKNTNHENRNL